MKYVKIIGLLAIAVAAMTAFAGPASAAKLTSPTGTEYGVGKTIKATAALTKWTGSFLTVECATSTVQGTITASGGSVVQGSFSTMDFTNCNFGVTVKKAGTFALQPIGSGNEVNGTLISTGTEVELHTSLGSCVLTTSNTSIGTFKGGKPASFEISGNIPRTAGNFLCGSSVLWESASYVVSTPSELWLDS